MTGMLSIQLKMYRFADSLSKFPIIDELINREVKLAETFTEQGPTLRSGATTFNTNLNHKNSLAVRLSELKNLYTCNLKQYTDIKDNPLPIDVIKTKIASYKKRFKARVRRSTLGLYT